MRNFSYAGQERERVAALRILALGPDAVVKVSKDLWRVRAETGHGYYEAKRERKGWTCQCPQFETHPYKRCKHLWARLIKAKPIEFASAGTSGRGATPVKPREWEAIGESRNAVEHELPDLVWDLVQQIPEPVGPVGKRGRPRASLRAQLYHAIMYVHRGTASEQFHGELEKACQGGKGVLLRPGNFTTPSRVFNAEGSFELLLKLIELSVLPLRAIEERGTIVVDSTGFATTVRSTYCDEHYGAATKRRYLKGHLVMGLRSRAVLAIAVTNERGADSPQFVPLVQKVVDAGFEPAIALADRAYTSRDNYQLLADLHIDGYLPFKMGSTGRTLGSPEFHRKFLQWSLHPEEFDEHYGQRSNIEAANHAVKAVLGDACLSKNLEAQSCEVLAKFLVYNLRRVIYWSHRLAIRSRDGIRPERGTDPTELSLDSLYSRPTFDSRNN